MDSNPKVASLAARLVEPNDPRHKRTSSDDEDDDEAIFAELEAEIENDSSYSMREQGLGVLRREMDRLKDMRENEHGRYSEVSDEKEVIRITAREPRCVVHFYHPNFKRCEIMDKHMAALAPKYFNTRFLRVFVENIPWLVEKLAIKVLPCVICFMDGVAKDRLVGFEELGNVDAFATAVLELRLSGSGVLQRQQPSGVNQIYTVSSSRRKGEDDEVFDLDE
ncbi:thioredoxin-like protein [Hymenopellis radicata]|nr:thioredoxin-like protein [Hymenopellis radicata]